MVAQANVSSASGHQYQLVRAFVIGRVSCIISLCDTLDLLT